MPLDLDGKLRAHLTRTLAGALEHAEVVGDFYILPWSMRDLRTAKTISDRGHLADRLRDLVDETPFVTFAVQELANGFRRLNREAQKVDRRPLIAYEGYADTMGVAAGIVDAFNSLPWNYTVIVKLPSSLNQFVIKSGAKIDLSKIHHVVLAKDLEEFAKGKPNYGLVDLMMNTPRREPWSETASYLMIDVEGYIADSTSEPMLKARDDVAAFMGLGLAFGLFIDEYTIFPDPSFESGATHYETFVQTDDTWAELEAFEIAENHRRRLEDLKCVPSPREGESNNDWLLRELGRIGTAMRSADGGRVRLAARWLFESYCSTDVLQQYVQTSVAVEILLGDEKKNDKVGLTALLANRCAYLIGKTPKARAQILNLFEELYDLRSRILHRGHNRLSRREVNQLDHLRTICMAVIREEHLLLERAEN